MASVSTLAELVTYFTSTEESNPNPFKLVLTGTYRSPLADLVLALHKAKRVSVVRPPPDPEGLLRPAANGVNGLSSGTHDAGQSAGPNSDSNVGAVRQPSSILKGSSTSGEGGGRAHNWVGTKVRMASRKYSEGHRSATGRVAGTMLVRQGAGAGVAEEDVEGESEAAAGMNNPQLTFVPVCTVQTYNGEGKKRRGGSRERQRDTRTYLTTDPPLPKHVSFKETALEHEFDTVSIDSSTADEESTLDGPEASGGKQVDPVLEAFRRWVGSSSRKSLSLAVPIAMPIDASGRPVKQLRGQQRPVTLPADMLDAIAQRIADDEAAELEEKERKSGAVRASDDQLFGSKAARRRAARITLV